MANPSTVLIVDDDEVSRQLIQGLLATENYTVLVAENGTRGLEIAAAARPDVVLLDIVMPGLDGYEVCHRLRANAELRQIPIVLLTALEGRESRLKGLAAGADEFLNKPVDPAELRTRVRTITGLNRFRQLYEQRMRFEAAVAHSPEAIVLTDGDGKILHFNGAFRRLVAPVPENIYACFPPEGVEALREQRAQRASQPTKLIPPHETSLLVSAAPNAFVEVTVVRLPWSEGTLLEFILRDVTERKQLEVQLMRMQRIELLGQLAGGIVHDVNNLLISVVSHAELLEMDGTPEVQERAKVMRQGAERGAALLRRILMFARGADPALAPLDVGQALRETVAIAGKLLGSNITLEVETPPGLPPIHGDASQVHQVLMNLCVNARDAMPHGGKLVLSGRAVTLGDDAHALGPDAVPGDFVAVSVRDTGVGIPPEIRSKLFDPFFSTKTRETATGLGLATVLRVMRRHQGFIAFESKVGDGTCFTCYFPALPDPSTL